MATIDVGPGKAFTRLNAVSPAPQPGDIVRLWPTTFSYTGGTETVDSWIGTIAAPIRIIQYDPANPAIFQRTLQLVNCRYLTIERPVFVSPRDPTNTVNVSAVQIDGNNSQSITVLNIDVTGSAVGYQLNDGGGKGHLLDGGTIKNTLRSVPGGPAGNGIGISSTSGTGWDPADRTVTIRNVTVTDAAGHGMECQGNWGVVDSCTVLRAGKDVAGISGIHILNTGYLNAGYGTAPNEGWHWYIARNTCNFCETPLGNTDQPYDGNGIQVDHEATDVLIENNSCEGNDGAGINIYECTSVRVLGNYCKDNSRDINGLHTGRGEILINGNIDAGVTTANIDVVGNTCISTLPRELSPGYPPEYGLYYYVMACTFTDTSLTVKWRDNTISVTGTGPAAILKNGANTYTSLAAWEAAVPTSTEPYTPPDENPTPPVVDPTTDARIAALESAVASLQSSNVQLTARVVAIEDRLTAVGDAWAAPL